MLSRLVLWLIGLYQRHLSPRKGYACAYRVLHGGTGCSGYAKEVIGTHGAIAAIPLIRTRFAGCRDAAVSLRISRKPRKVTGRNELKNSKLDWCGDPCTPCCDCGSSHGCSLIGRKSAPDCDLPCECGGP
ncbi:membrane protein insertion efficiency factor YidD [Pseudogemmobacter bohemicus]|uniref:membrane protein insertion efficiency factor YidD n=1 Tax=Pseudogemmobacter bohemicus TaxID=2250708 RepID=UPI0018E57BE8|nr:membrane protein insertion efficiency factor YidD [Pseudogemmobacter bohemicus]